MVDAMGRGSKGRRTDGFPNTPREHVSKKDGIVAYHTFGIEQSGRNDGLDHDDLLDGVDCGGRGNVLMVDEVVVPLCAQEILL